MPPMLNKEIFPKVLDHLLNYFVALVELTMLHSV